MALQNYGHSQDVPPPTHFNLELALLQFRMRGFTARTFYGYKK